MLAEPAKTGRAWSPIKGLTLAERGPFQVQARVRRTGRPSQTTTFETVADAEAWGVGVTRQRLRNAIEQGSWGNSFDAGSSMAAKTVQAMHHARDAHSNRNRSSSANQTRRLRFSAPSRLGACASIPLTTFAFRHTAAH